MQWTPLGAGLKCVRRGLSVLASGPADKDGFFLCVNVLWFLHVECNMDINLDRVNVFMSSWIHGPVQPWIRERNKTRMLMKTLSLCCDRRSLLSTCGGRLGPEVRI